MNFLLMDFGTTSIKTSIVDLDTGAFSYIKGHPSVSNLAVMPGRYEISPSSLRERFLSICDFYFAQLGIQFEGIAICSEQNGFVALNQENVPITNYISWKDERSLEPIDGKDTFSLVLDELGDDFKRITGWRPGPGLPIMNAAHLARLSLLESPCKIVSLPEWLSLCCDDATEIVHDTMLHGLGFYDVREKRISVELTDRIEELTGVQFVFNSVAPTGKVSGYWHRPNKKTPIYVGIGDHQCSVLGAANVPGQSVSLNLGTGSQVAVIDPVTIPRGAELRPYFDSRLLVAITRIPGGRALAGYLGLLEDVCKQATGNEVNFWDRLKEFDENDILNATLDLNLGIFSSAWNYRGGGSISNIHEASLTLKDYLASLLKSFAHQYLEVMRLFDPNHRMQSCILSGGVARRLPVVHRLISSLSGYDTLTACEVDESLLGLRTVLLVAAGHAKSCGEAQEIYGRNYSVRQALD